MSCTEGDADAVDAREIDIPGITQETNTTSIHIKRFSISGLQHRSGTVGGLISDLWMAIRNRSGDRPLRGLFAAQSAVIAIATSLVLAHIK